MCQFQAKLQLKERLRNNMSDREKEIRAKVETVRPKEAIKHGLAYSYNKADMLKLKKHAAEDMAFLIQTLDNERDLNSSITSDESNHDMGVMLHRQDLELENLKKELSNSTELNNSKLLKAFAKALGVEDAGGWTTGTLILNALAEINKKP
jgi:hypothetical protein